MDTDLFVPLSFETLRRRAEVEFAEKAATGPGFGDSVVLGPGGQIAGFLNDRRTNRWADKAMYFYLYQRHPIVYACVELICQTAAQDRHTYPTKDTPGKGERPHPESGYMGTPRARGGRSYGKVPEGQYKEDDGSEKDLSLNDYPDDGIEFLENFFAEVNDFESFGDLLQGVYRDMLIGGEAFVLKQRLGAKVVQGTLATPGDGATGQFDGYGRVTHVASNPNAPVVSLHRIPSRDTYAVPGDDGYPAVIRQKAEGGGYREYSVQDVIFLKLPDPSDPSRGLSPLEALDISLATDVSASKYNEAYFRNGAKAGMVFSIAQASEHEIRRNREWITNVYTQPENAHKPMLLLGNVNLVRDGNKAQQDMDFILLRKFTREEICAVYSVPLSKILHDSGNNLGQAGKLSDDMTFRADTVGPLQTKVYEGVNRQLMRRDFPNHPLLIPPRQEKIRLDLLEAAKSLVMCGGTGNEARAVLHLPTYDDDDMMNKPLFLTPGLRTMDPKDDNNPLGLNQTAVAAPGQGPAGRAGASDAKRADRTSRRTSNGRLNKKLKSSALSGQDSEVAGELDGVELVESELDEGV